MEKVGLNRKVDNKKTGNYGEEIACNYLIRHGYSILDRNYRKKWGELDIVASKQGILNFIEVKSVSVNFLAKNIRMLRPEENVNEKKLKQIRKMIMTYCAEKGLGLEVMYRFHVICVFMDFLQRTAKIRMIKDIIL